MSKPFKNMFISKKIIIPFIIEIKDYLKELEGYEFVPGNGTLMEDPLKTKTLVYAAGVTTTSTPEKRPNISIARGPIQRLRSVIGNVAQPWNMWDDEKSYGEIWKTTVNIKIIAREFLESENIASFLFWRLEHNKAKFRTYGLTDIYPDYLSKPQPTEGRGDNKVDSWVTGININVSVHESYMLTPFVSEPAIKEFEFIQNMAETNVHFEK